MAVFAVLAASLAGTFFGLLSKLLQCKTLILCMEGEGFQTQAIFYLFFRSKLFELLVIIAMGFFFVINWPPWIFDSHALIEQMPF